MKKNVQSLFRIVFICLNLLVPVMGASIPLWRQGKSISDCKPTWSDEFWWWQQAKAVADHGAPWGYFGYNGGKAQVGTFAAWGMMAVMPYALFAKLFGWTYHSYVYANLFYQVLGILLFILLVKPGSKALLLMLLVNAGQVIRTDYLIVAMQESVRCSLGLVAAGILVWLYRHRNETGKKSNFLYAAAGVYLFAIGQIYLIWTVFFLPYFWLLNRKRPTWAAVGLATAETAGTVWLSKKLLALTCTPYLPGYALWDGLRINWRDYMEYFATDKHELFFRVFHVGTVALLVAILAWLVVRRKKLPRSEIVLCLWCCALPAVFLAGHIALYNTTLWTFTRGMAMGLFVFAFGVCALESTFPRAAVAIWCLSCLLSFAAGSDAIKFEKETARYKTEAWKRQVEKTKAAMADLEAFLETSPKTDPWDYTVGTYLLSSPITFAMPSAYADNTMIYGKPCERVGWVMIGKIVDPKRAAKVKNAYLSMDYSISSESDELIVLKKNSLT